jgi:hypothetical protein
VIGCATIVGLVVAVIAFALRPTRIRWRPSRWRCCALPAANVFPIYPAIAKDWVFTGEHLAYLPLAALATDRRRRLLCACLSPRPAARLPPSQCSPSRLLRSCSRGARLCSRLSAP